MNIKGFAILVTLTVVSVSAFATGVRLVETMNRAVPQPVAGVVDGAATPALADATARFARSTASFGGTLPNSR